MGAEGWVCMYLPNAPARWDASSRRRHQVSRLPTRPAAAARFMAKANFFFCCALAPFSRSPLGSVQPARPPRRRPPSRGNPFPALLRQPPRTPRRRSRSPMDLPVSVGSLRRLPRWYRLCSKTGAPTPWLLAALRLNVNRFFFFLCGPFWGGCFAGVTLRWRRAPAFPRVAGAGPKGGGPPCLTSQLDRVCSVAASIADRPRLAPAGW